MPTIQRGDRLDIEPFGCRHYGRIDGSEGQISVLSYEFGDAKPISSGHRIGREIPRRKVAQEADLSLRPDTGLDEIRHLSDHQLRHDQGTRVTEKQRKAGLVVSVVFVDVGVQRPGVDQEGYRRASRRKICSIFLAVSRWPLLPAFAAINLRRLPPR